MKRAKVARVSLWNGVVAKYAHKHKETDRPVGCSAPVDANASLQIFHIISI